MSAAGPRLWADVVHWGLRQARQGGPVDEEQLEAEYRRRVADVERREAARAAGAAAFAPVEGASTPATPGVSRRRLLEIGGSAAGLLTVQGATALGAAKLMTGSSPDVPAAVRAAGGHTAVDGSADRDPTRIDHVALARINAGKSLFAPFPGGPVQPIPGHEARLHPPPPQPAQPGRLRQFTLNVEDRVLEVARGVRFAAWTFDGAVPGPVLRVTEGDDVRITLRNGLDMPHSLHLHGIHPASQDGVLQFVPPGGEGVYEFTAEPFGVFPYHCHVDPMDQHQSRGLYGAMIVDPPVPRPPAHEMVMVLNGYDLDFDTANELYGVNGMCGYYHDHPIDLHVGELNRIYVVNMTEFDPLNSIHLHANMFQYYPAGTSLRPSVLTDVVHLGMADRGILEFTYRYGGQYLFHAHQTELSMKGWNGLFDVA